MMMMIRGGGWRTLEPPEAYKAVPHRVLGLDGKLRGTS